MSTPGFSGPSCCVVPSFDRRTRATTSGPPSLRLGGEVIHALIGIGIPVQSDNCVSELIIELERIFLSEQ